MLEATGVVTADLDMATTAFLALLEVAAAFLAVLALGAVKIIGVMDIETDGIMMVIGVNTGDNDIMDVELLLVI
jgi:hypothetical protein